MSWEEKSDISPFQYLRWRGVPQSRGGIFLLGIITFSERWGSLFQNRRIVFDCCGIF